MRNKIFSIVWMSCLLLVGSTMLTACGDDDELNTDQYGGDITLGAFGPCPVLRGGTLYFYGTNLDQITEIDIPGADPITAIEVIEKGKHSKISITVPAEKCEEGIVTLKTAKGGVINTVSPIVYREDIEITDVYIGSTGNLTGAVGQEVTIKGDYLNLMHGVIFAGGTTIEEDAFTAHDRYTIRVVIPKEAASGKLTLTDLAETPTELQTEEAIVVKLPEVAAVAATIKAGNVVTVTGESMNLIESVDLPGGVTLVEEDISYAEDGKSISFTVSRDVQDGEIVLITYSGEKIVAGTITTVVPTNLAVNPAPVKAGKALTITGTDIDLVATVEFPNVGMYQDWEHFTVDAEKVVIGAVPETAQEGDIVLNMQNGKQVTVAYTLVTPTVTSADPDNIMAGEETIIYGTDLDLVASITFPGEGAPTLGAADFTAQEEEGIQLTTPASAVGSGFTLNLKNGESIDVAGVLTLTASTNPTIATMPEKAVPGTEITITGKNLNNVDVFYIADVKVTRFGSRTATEVTMTVPADAALGETPIVMVDFEGKTYESDQKLKVVPAETTLWEGAIGPTNWNGDVQIPMTDAIKAELVAGRTMGIEFVCSDDAGWWQIEICGSWWTGLPGVCLQYSGDEGTRSIMDFQKTDTKFEWTLLQGDVDILLQQGAMLFVGNGAIITRLYIK